MRRALILLLALAAIALTAAGCGDSGSSGNAFDDSLGYMPKNSLAVVAIKTDPDDPQFKNIEKIVDKFPFASQIKNGLKQRINTGGTNYEDDIKPLLGNDFVVGVPPGSVSAQQEGDDNPYVLAWKTAGGDIDDLIGKSSKKVGESNGATIYQDADGSANAVKDDTVIAAKTRPLLDAALKAHDADDPYSEDDFNAGLGDLNQDSVLRVSGNLQTILADDPDAAEALKVPWVKGLRTFGATLTTAEDGLSVDFRVNTEGVTAEQSPVAVGAASAPVVQRPGEVGIGMRNPSQLVNFIIGVAGVTDPEGLRDKEKAEEDLGIDLENDVLAQLEGNASASVSLDGKAAARADLKDPAAFEETLAKIMRNLNKAERAQNDPPSDVEELGDGLYSVSDPDDEPTIIGVVQDKLVLASDEDRAKEIAAQSAAPVPNEKGALVMTADPKTIVNKALEEQGNSGAALLIGPAISSHLDVLSGSVEGQADGLRGHVHLGVK